MKIQRIINLCKKTGGLYITQREDAQWVGNGQAIYPLYDLPRLTAEELCTIYAVSEEAQGKMILNDKEESEYLVDFSDLNGDEEAAEVIKLGITYGGHVLMLLKCGDEINFVKRIYLTPFEEEVQFWRRESEIGTYYVATAGMILKGIIIPERGFRADIAAEIKEVADKL